MSTIFPKTLPKLFAQGVTGILPAKGIPSAGGVIYPMRFFGAKATDHSYAKIFYDEHDVKFVKGEGSKLIDDKGKEYWDAHSAYGVTLFGHSMGNLYGDVLKRIMNNEIPMTHGAFPKQGTENAAMLIAQKTAACLGGEAKDWQVYFNNTGAEAVETSLKFARKHGTEIKKLSDSDKIVYALEGCFHGRALGGTSLFSHDKKKSRDGFGPLLTGIKHLQMNDIDGLKALEKDGANTAAIILEPIQGEGGINMPTDKWVKELAKICKEQKILIVADEVQSGLHRTGPFWASAHFKESGFQPDIIASAKALGGGLYPVGAVIMKREVADLLEPGMHGSTFGGNNIAMEVVGRTMELIDEQNIEKNVAKQSGLLETLLDKLQENNPDTIVDTTGKGLWRGIRLNPELSTHEVAKTIIKNGVITGESGAKVLRFAPALNITSEDLIATVNCLGKGFSEISQNPDKHKEKESAVARVAAKTNKNVANYR